MLNASARRLCRGKAAGNSVFFRRSGWRGWTARLFVGGAALSVSVFAVREIVPDRSRRWSWLRCLNAASALAALTLDYKILGFLDVSASHRRSARRLVRLAERNRGVYVKLAQHAASMHYLLPPEYTDQLQSLQQAAPATPFEEVSAILREELGVGDLSLVFSQIDSEPVGAASLAQVHFAVLKSGEAVAVKVQHPDVRALAEADTRVVSFLTKLASALFPSVRFEWLASLLRENLPRELDFTLEAANAEECRARLQAKASSFQLALPRRFSFETLLFRAIAKAVGECLDSGVESPASLESAKNAVANEFSSWGEKTPDGGPPEGTKMFDEYEVELHVPEVYRHLTTPRVLVMERCRGVSVDDRRSLLEKGVRPLAVSGALCEMYGRLIFEEGFVHADPHPGNLLVHAAEEAAVSAKRIDSRPLLLSSLKPTRVSSERRRCHLRLTLLDHGLYCLLSSSFRDCYAALWVALQKGDSAAVEACARRFGVSKLGDLLAVILSLRSPERCIHGYVSYPLRHSQPARKPSGKRAVSVCSIEGGLGLSCKSSEEAEFLKRSFPGYFGRITQVLQDVPRELILLIKTNDLLRAIQTKLQVEETSVLIPMLERAHAVVRRAEWEAFKKGEVSVWQAGPSQLRCFASEWSLGFVGRLLALREMALTTPTEERGIDWFCAWF